MVSVKSARRLVGHAGAVAVKPCSAALGSSAVAIRQRQGDGRTPKGVFRTERKTALSAVILSSGLDCPQAEDRASGKAGQYDPGG